MRQSLKVMSTLAVAVAFERSLIPAWRAMSYDVEVEWAPTAVLMQRILSGERADVLIMTDGSMSELIAADVIRSETMTPIAQAGCGLAVPAGAPHPDVSTREAFHRTLLAARSIVYSRTGASGLYFAELIQKLGIAESVNSRAIVIPAGFTAERLLTGECDLAVQQISELMSVEGVEVVGPFPESLQVTTDFSAAIFITATDAELAARFVAHLSNARAVEAYGSGGLKPRLIRHTRRS
jgi:molybdate transport system substrate-binding protein